MRTRLLRSTLATVAFAASASAARGQGGAFREIATLGRYENEGWIAATSDGRSVLVAVDSALVLVDVRSGRTTVIARGWFRRPALSQQTTHLAFDRAGEGGGSEVWVARVDLRRGVVDSLRKLVAARSHSPIFSPDGRTVAFARSNADSTSLAIVSFEGGPVRTLSASAADLVPVGWSPDGNSIYYTANTNGVRDNAYPVARLDVASGTVTRVLPRNFLRRARLSPDGSQILYMPTTQALGIARTNGDSVSVIPIEQLDAGRSVSPPEWIGPKGGFAMTSLIEPRMLIAHDLASGTSARLPDGSAWMGASAISHDNKRVAVISTRDGPQRLSVVPMSGAGIRTFSTRRAIAPSNPNALPLWSPDDRYVAVPTGNVDKLVSHRNAAGIDVIELATSRVVTLDIDHEVARYEWSPDSRAIRYVHQDSDSPDPRPMQIREASLQGGNRVVRELKRSSGAIFFQDFDHAYSREDGALIDLRTGAIRVLVPPSEFPEPWIVPALPCFSPNGEWMALPTSAAGRGPYDRVKLVAVRTGERRVLDPGFPRMRPASVQCHPDNQHLIVTGTDSAGVTRMVLLTIADGTRRAITEVDDDLVGSIQFAVAPDGKTLVVSRRQPPLPLTLVLFDGVKK